MLGWGCGEQRGSRDGCVGATGSVGVGATVDASLGWANQSAWNGPGKTTDSPVGRKWVEAAPGFFAGGPSPTLAGEKKQPLNMHRLGLRRQAYKRALAQTNERFVLLLWLTKKACDHPTLLNDFRFSRTQISYYFFNFNRAHTRMFHTQYVQ